MEVRHLRNKIEQLIKNNNENKKTFNNNSNCTNINSF